MPPENEPTPVTDDVPVVRDDNPSAPPPSNPEKKPDPVPEKKPDPAPKQPSEPSTPPPAQKDDGKFEPSAEWQQHINTIAGTARNEGRQAALRELGLSGDVEADKKTVEALKKGQNEAITALQTQVNDLTQKTTDATKQVEDFQLQRDELARLLRKTVVESVIEREAAKRGFKNVADAVLFLTPMIDADKEAKIDVDARTVDKLDGFFESLVKERPYLIGQSAMDIPPSPDGNTPPPNPQGKERDEFRNRVRGWF